MSSEMEAKTAEEQKYLSAEDILAKDDIDFIDIPVKEWGGTICCMSLTGDDAIQFYKDFQDPEKKEAAIIRMFVLSVVDNPTNRKRIFNEAKIERLRKHKYGIFLRVQEKLLVFNGFKKEGADAAKNA